LTAARLEGRLGEVLYGLASVHAHACGQDSADVNAGGVALQHAVGDEHQPVACLQGQRLHPVAGSGLHAERAVSLQTNLLNLPGPQPERRRMTGVDDARRRARQVNAHQQAGNELAVARLLGERIVRQPRLFGELHSSPAGVA
jgi:hypothetical protein